jgi:hypothetical protein
MQFDCPITPLELAYLVEAGVGRLSGNNGSGLVLVVAILLSVRAKWSMRSSKAMGTGKPASPVKRNVKRKIFSIGSIPPHSCLGIQPTV